ncbi:hypothetical protein OO013_02800 [Mangrovivirga sp. M17]|uniref:Uncharacterized protein n=1 Tax=Mangrovivirga halotolerans TaxID=2993936 RepID=A0ABT3RMT2_9BACT|nr:hypothetical protein [Mangrovivirga halotolerans]MCX2742776.1 hypothetical protein [Mangrovivirga halotolerans]
MKKYLVLIMSWVLIIAIACDDDDNNDQGNPNPPEENIIDENGGSVTSNDGVMEINIPANALSESTAITVEQTEEPVPGTLDLNQNAYNWGPDGTQFNIPAVLTYNYRNDNVPISGADELLTMAYYENSALIEIPSIVNASTKTIQADVEHFTVFTIVARQEWLVNFNGTNYLMDDELSLVYKEGLSDPFDEENNTNPTHYLYNLEIGDQLENIILDIYLYAPEESDFLNSTFEFRNEASVTPEDVANSTFFFDARLVLNQNQVDIKPVSGTIELKGNIEENRYYLIFNLIYPDDESLTGSYYGNFTEVQ